MGEDEEKPEQENIEDALFDCLKKKLDDGSIKAMEARILLEMTDRRSSRIKKGAPIPGLLRKLPFDLEPPIAK
jgi:hypothetical protein